MKKRPFLLIESLIALSLLALCAVPLVKQPLLFYKDEMNFLTQMEIERLADWTFTEVKELLLKNELPWDEIPPQNQRTGPFPLSDGKIQIPGCKTKRVARSFSLRGKGEKTGANKNLYRQVYLEIEIDKKKFEFRVPIEKVNME